jgi:hypothetical protein
MSPRAMTAEEQERHRLLCNGVRSCITILQFFDSDAQDLRVALARLQNWLAENDGRWTK